MTLRDKLEQVASSLNSDVDEGARIFVCLGPPRCYGNSEPCPFCTVVESDDKRSTIEIMNFVEKGH